MDMGGDVNNSEDKQAGIELDLKLEALPRESLIGLVRLYSRLMMDIDGFWFLSMKARASNEEAIACDNWVWGRVVKKMLDDLAKLIGVQGRDVADFMTVIQATPLHYVVEEKMEAHDRNRATLTVTYCPTLAALEREDKSGQRESARARRRGLLAVALLKGDVIESLGMMKLEGNPVEGLVEKLAELMPYSRQQVNEDISKWVKAGLLKYDIKDGHLVWRWS